MAEPVCAIVGVGPGNRVAFARAFRDDGYSTALLTRRPEVISFLAAEAGSDLAAGKSQGDPIMATAQD